MSDVTIQAQQARHQLAQALGALQGDGLPDSLEPVAGIVAQAMSLLHRVETRGERGETSTAALSAVREALNALQTNTVDHPAADVALEHVAMSLSLVHKLDQTLRHAPQDVNEQKRDASFATAATVAEPVAVSAAPAAPVATAAPNTAAPNTAASDTAAAPKPVVSPAGAEAASTAQEAPIPLTKPTPSVAPSHGDRRSLPPVSLPGLPPAEGELFAEAALGAYSTTNFFKGLSGNDVVDAGGLFIATYDLPDLGQRVRVRVTMPGGFEFEARGTVAWIREMPQTGSLNPLSPPGYGVRFTEISTEARQLIYRYVRNREPLFYDDL